jgi:hypothetical protein
VTRDRDLKGDDIPLGEYTMDKDVPTIVPYRVEFGIYYSRMC